MKEEEWQKYLDTVMSQQKTEVHEPNLDILRLFCKYIPEPDYLRILEIAAGAGVDMKVLLERGYEVEGIDLLPENRSYAKENFDIYIHGQDMHSLKFPSSSFDGILSIQTFEHALSSFIVASEMSRVLRNGGRIFLDTSDPDDRDMWGPHHPSLLYPKQIIGLFNLLEFDVLKDFSRRHRTQIIFEKRGRE